MIAQKHTGRLMLPRASRFLWVIALMGALIASPGGSSSVERGLAAAQAALFSEIKLSLCSVARGEEDQAPPSQEPSATCFHCCLPTSIRLAMPGPAPEIAFLPDTAFKVLRLSFLPASWRETDPPPTPHRPRDPPHLPLKPDVFPLSMKDRKDEIRLSRPPWRGASFVYLADGCRPCDA